MQRRKGASIIAEARFQVQGGDSQGKFHQVEVEGVWNGRASTYTYDHTTWRLASVATNGVYTAYAYDAQGNVTARGTQGFHFDQGNRMTLALGKGMYTYDGLGRRTSITGADGSYRIQVYSQAGQLLYGTLQQGAVVQRTRYVYLGGKQIAETNSIGGTQYVHTDALGSPVARTNASGALINRTSYEPYGNTAAGTIPNGPGFTGHVNDPDTGLVYMQQRYYDPIAGRFLSVDPIVTDANTGKGFNLYEYVNSNPYKYTDPDGRDAWYRDIPPPPPPVQQLQRVTVTAPRITTSPTAPSVNIPVLTLVRAATPWALLLTPSSLGTPACEMPGGPTCGIRSEQSGLGETKPNDAPTGTIGLDQAGRKFGWTRTRGTGSKILRLAVWLAVELGSASLPMALSASTRVADGSRKATTTT